MDSTALTPLNPDAVYACLSRRQSLPTLPTTFAKIIEVANNQNANVLDLAEIISCDPILMANVLRVANSSYYSLSEPIEDLSNAIMYLGISEIKRVALSVGSFDVFSAKKVSSEYLKNIWRHSLITGLISQQIAKSAHFDFADDAYLGGLLHDLGKLFFATFFSSPYALLRSEVAAGTANSLSLESQVFGMTHLDAAADLCVHWKLPVKISLISTNHHEPTQSENGEYFLCLCVAASNILAHQIIKDEPVDHLLPQAHTWLAELASQSQYPAALDPNCIQAIMISELERAKRLEEVTTSKC